MNTAEMDTKFTEALEKVVNRAGRNFVYESPKLNHDGSKNSLETCMYIDPETGDPSCMIAQALAEMKIELKEEWDGEPVAMTADEVLSELGFSEKIQIAATQAQNLQDELKTWGEAIDRYFEVLNQVEV